MAESGYTIRSFAAELGLHEVTLSEKLKTGKFSVPEANEISKLLKFSKSDVANIFFAD